MTCVRDSGCPTDAELAAFAAGEVPAPALDTLADHLQACPACQERLERLDRSDDRILQAIRAAPAGPSRDGRMTLLWGEPPAAKAAGAPADRSPGPRRPVTPGTYPLLADEIRDLLHRRLRVAAVLGGVTLGWILAQQVAGGAAAETALGERWFNPILLGVSLAVHAAGGALVWSRRRLSMAALRGVELVFLASLLLCLAQYRYAAFTAVSAEPVDGPQHRAMLVRDVALLSNMQWYFAIMAFGTFMPNTGRRCVAFVSVVAVLMLGINLAAAWESPAIREQLPLLMNLTGIGLFLAGGMAVYGSFKISTLRSAAAVARQEAKELGQYRLTRQLGAGGMGEVYLAEHRLLKRPCAVKLIRPERAGDADTLRRFEREVQATARLNHPNTVEIYDYGHGADGTFYYAMEYLPGLTLEELVRRHGPLPPARAVAVLRQLCGALRAAHGAGLIHRDLKPGNVILCPGGPPYDRVKLLDFGLARAAGLSTADTRLTQEGTILGTPAYMAPEQAAGTGTLDARCDLYSLGAVAYYLLAGRPPFTEGNAMQILVAHMTEPAPPLRPARPEVPEDLERIVLRCLAKKAGDRFPDAAALDHALAACACAGQWTEDAAAAWWDARGGAAAAGGVSAAETVGA